jgi:hypothetical protein
MTTVVVAGALANKPSNGGGAWTRLSWLLALRALGCEAWFFEQADRGDPEALAFFDLATAQLGLESHAILLERSGRRIAGSTADPYTVAREADLLVNHSGHLRIASLRKAFARALYLDLDPGYTQAWHAQGLDVGLAGHDFYFTVGANLGRAECSIPTGGLDWHATRQPVPLDWWRVARGGAHECFTTVASWRGPYGSVEVDGRTLGGKAHEFRRFVELPRRAEQRFELALDIDPSDAADAARLRDNGWRLVDPRAVAADPLLYRDYVARSGAEISISQSVYVATESGWFGDRSARYLAAGKPVLAQDTGLLRTLPTGQGLVTFTTLDEAVAGASAIASEYETHASAARTLAEEYFDGTVVVRRVLEAVLP